jgi:hypothetical protein
MSSIIIQVGGGLVRDVFKTGKGDPRQVIVVDFDVEGEEGTTKTEDADGAFLEAMVQDYGFSKLPRGSDVDRIVKAWTKNWKKELKNK